jgi:DNA-binding LacI/PurR family transcriptional regulator
MARTMVERLIARLADPKVAPGEFLFKPSLVQRESVAEPPATRKTAGPKGAP